MSAAHLLFAAFTTVWALTPPIFFGALALFCLVGMVVQWRTYYDRTGDDLRVPGVVSTLVFAFAAWVTSTWAAQLLTSAGQ